MSFDEKKATLLAAMQQEASFWTLKELEVLGKSKGVIPQAVKDVVESLVGEDEVQSDKASRVEPSKTSVCELSLCRSRK